MFRKLLVAVDGSEAARHAVLSAVELAKLSRGGVVAVHVSPAYKPNVREEGTTAGFVAPDDYARKALLEAQRHFAYVVEAAKAHDVACESHSLLSDQIASSVVDAAGRYGCDTIVMGSHGHKGIRRMLLGSVAQEVLASASTPVVVVR